MQHCMYIIRDIRCTCNLLLFRHLNQAIILTPEHGECRTVLNLECVDCGDT